MDTYSVRVVGTHSLIARCRHCPAKASTVGRLGCTAAVDCLCDQNFYGGGHANGGGCVRCPDYSATATAGSSSVELCVCNENLGVKRIGNDCGCVDGSYMKHTIQTCSACGFGVVCVWLSNATRSVLPPDVARGFWASTFPVTQLLAFSGHIVFKCKSETTCPLGQNVCAKNRFGRACSLCVPGSFGSPDGDCTECLLAPSDLRAAQVPLAFALMCMLAVAQKKTVDKDKFSYRNGRPGRKPLATSATQILKFSQLLGIVLASKFQWPASCTSVLGPAASGSKELAGSVGVACLDEQQSVALEIYFVTLLPVYLIGLMGPSSLIASGARALLRAGRAVKRLSGDVLKRLSQRLSGEVAPAQRVSGEAPLDGKRRQSFRGRLEGLILDPSEHMRKVAFMIVSLLFTSTLQGGLIIATCSLNPNGDRTVSSYPHMKCLSQEWFNIAPFPLAFSALFVAGVFATRWFTIRQVAFSLGCSNGREKGFWYLTVGCFRSSQITWPLTLLARDIAANFVPVLFPDDGTAQAICLSYISLIVGVASLTVRPYLDEANNALDVWTSAALFMLTNFAGGMGFATTEDGESGDGGDAIRSAWLLVIVLLGVAGVVAILTYQLFLLAGCPAALFPQCLRPVSPATRRTRKAYIIGQLGGGSGLRDTVRNFDGVEWKHFDHQLSTSMATIRILQARRATLLPQARAVAVGLGGRPRTEIQQLEGSVQWQLNQQELKSTKLKLQELEEQVQKASAQERHLREQLERSQQRADESRAQAELWQERLKAAKAKPPAEQLAEQQKARLNYLEALQENQQGALGQRQHGTSGPVENIFDL